MTAAPIKCKAAVAWAPNQPLKVETITVEAPKKGEVRVRILYTSVCHTDQYTLSGADPEGNFPCILGHEGAGIVESVGEGVSSVQVGDHVVPLYMPQCRECKFCKSSKTNLCSRIRDTQCKGLMPDGSSRFSLDGKPIFHYMGTSTFSEFTVLAEISVSKIDAKAPLDRMALLGCGVSTGYGAALNVADVQPGDTVAVFGLGTVGLAVVLGARERGASRIIGVDLNEERLELSRSFGVTDLVNPSKFAGQAVENVLIEMTDGGLDHTFECIGNVDVMRSAFLATHKGWGQSIVIGVAGAGQEVSARPFNLIIGRAWKGCAFGGWKSRDSLPKLVDLCQNGKLEVDKFITHRESRPESLNKVFEILLSGQSLRCVVGFNEAA